MWRNILYLHLRCQMQLQYLLPFFSCSSILRQGKTLSYIKRLKFEIVEYHIKAIQWPGWMIRGSNSDRGKTLISKNQGVHSTSYSQVSSPQFTRLGREADHSTPFSAYVKNKCSCDSILLYPFMLYTGNTLFSELYVVRYVHCRWPFHNIQTKKRKMFFHRYLYCVNFRQICRLPRRYCTWRSHFT